MSKKCANFPKTGCENLVLGKGMILCISCINERKTLTLNRKEQDVYEMLKRIAVLEHELEVEREKTQQINQLNSIINDLTEEKKNFEKNTGFQELNRSQAEIDNVKLTMDIQKLSLENENLKSQNEILGKENADLTVLLENLKKSKIPVRKV